MSRRLVAPAIIAGVALIIIAASALFTVKETQQAVILQFGAPVRVIQNAGLHAKVPFIQTVFYVDKRILALYTPPEEVIASDQKRLVVDAFARFRITDPVRFRQSFASEAVARSRLATMLNSSLRQVLGSQSFSAVLSEQRGRLMVQIRDRMNAEAASDGLRIVDVRIRRADLPEANSQAIYRRMETAREREAREARAQGAEIGQRIRSRADKEATVMLAEARRDAEIARGEGDAERSRIYADAFGEDPEFFRFFRSLQAYQAAMEKGATTFVLSPKTEFFRFFEDSGTGPADVARRAAERAKAVKEAPAGAREPSGAVR